MTTFRRGAQLVDAAAFDGSAASGAAIRARFGRAVDQDGDRLEVATGFGRVFIGAGMWVVRDQATRCIDVVDHRDFHAAYEPIALEDPTHQGSRP